MQLMHHSSTDWAVQSVDASGFKVQNQLYCAPFLLHAAGVRAHTLTLSGLSAHEVADLLGADKPDVVIMSTGTQLRFPSAEVRAAFLSLGVGVEVMDQKAAAFTYNVLLQEQREVWLLALPD
jgi:uncharacterized protein